MNVNSESSEKVIFVNRYEMVFRLNGLLNNLQAYFSTRLNVSKDVPANDIEYFQNKLEIIRQLNRTPEVFDNDILMQELIDEYSPIMKAINFGEEIPIVK
ncbi:MAG: hypothetical protein KA327_11340 [Pseudarcicella sp.]|nr:hypothetical protein [Pseudarcicella sp.]